jgi:hypothetical protein
VTGPVDPPRVVEASAAYFGLPAADVLGSGRAADVALARQVAMFLCRRLLGLSLPAVGRVFDRDHSTVLHAARKVEGLTQSRAASAAVVRVAVRRLEWELSPAPRRHPLAAVALRRCRDLHTAPRAGLACRDCRTAAVAADDRMAAECELPAEPPAPDPGLVDAVAVERAAAGERVRLTRAERAELARWVFAGRVAHQLGMSGTALRAAAESAVA